MARRTDGNQAAIVAALRGVGASVLPIASPTVAGVPDLIVGYIGTDGRSRNLLMEVKTAKGRLEPEQETFLATWPGPALVVRSVEEALRAIGVDVG